jgi:hypothetical protein
MDKRTNNTTAQRKWIKGQTIQEPKEKGQKAFFFGLLYCASFCPFSLGCCIVCPFVIFLWAVVLFVLFLRAVVLFVLLSFWTKGQTIQQPKDKDKRKDNTTAQRKRKKGQTIPQPKEKGQKDKQYNSPSLSFCPFSLGCCIVCPFVRFLWAVVFFIVLSIFFGLLYC